MSVIIRLLFTCVALAWLSPRQGHAQEAPYLLLSDTTEVYRLDTSIEVFIDSTNRVAIEEITSGFQGRFKQSAGNLTFGYLKYPLWLKVKTRTTKPFTHWMLEIPAPFLEYVDFYQVEKGTWYLSESGYYRPQHVREIPHTNHVFSLRFEPDSTSTVYIRITGLSPKTFPVYAVEKEKFFGKTRYEDIGYGFFFGTLVVMFFYNLFIYLTLKQKNYLLYISTIVCTFLIFASASGYAGKFMWPETPVLNYYAGRLSLGVIVILLSIFTIRFLEVRKYSRVMYYILMALIPVAVIAILLVATKGASSAGNNLISLSTIIYMTTGVVCRVKGNKTATYFIAAWSIYLFGGLLLTLRNSGVLDYNFWTTHFVEIGAALETVIIAFALGDRYRRYEREKEEVQLLALKVQQDATDKLETKVKERTEELSNANAELQATLETIQQQTKVIENKNAELDSFFYRISHDLKGPVSSMLGLSHLAVREVKDAQALEYIERQHAQAERLNHIIQALINLTKFNHADLPKELIDFSKLIDDCLSSFTDLPDYQKIKITKDIQPGIRFYSEWILLTAIFQNLIENAIKYSREVDPYMKISVKQEGELLILQVADNGQGIPEAHQSKIFEMFYRASHTASGTGLGLYILKRSVDRLKGTIEIDSEPEIGSAFTVKLPMHP